MYRLWINVWIIISIVLFFTFYYGCEKDPQNKIFPKIIDLGDVAVNEKITKIVNVKNNSNKVLIINDIINSCNCSILTISEKKIEPKSIFSLHIHYIGGTNTGVNTKKISIKTNLQIYELQISANVIDYWHVLPSKVIDLGKIPKYSEKNIQIQILNTLNASFDIQSATSENKNIQIEIGKYLKNKGCLINLIYRSEEDLKHFYSKVFITTNLKKQPKIIIEVCGKVVGMVKSNPSQLFFGRLKAGEIKYGTIEVTTIDCSIPFQINEILIHDKQLKCKKIERVDKNSFVIVFCLTCPQEIGFQSSNFQLITNLKKDEKSQISYSYYVTRK